MGASPVSSNYCKSCQDHKSINWNLGHYTRSVVTPLRTLWSSVYPPDVNWESVLNGKYAGEALRRVPELPLEIADFAQVVLGKVRRRSK